MAEIMNRIAKLGSAPEQPNRDDLGELKKRISPRPAVLTAEAIQPKDKEEKKDLAQRALREPELKNWFEEKQKEISDKFEAKERAAQKGEALQMLAQAVTQFGAAMAGQKAGVDLSGLNFIKQDFDKQLDRLARRREVEEAGLRQELGSRRRLAELLGEREERKKERAEDVAFREKKLAASEQEAKEKAKAADKPRDFMNRSGDVIRVYPDGRTEVLQRGRAGDVQQARQELAERKQEHMEREKDEPTPKQVEEFAAFGEAKDLLAKIKEKKTLDEVDTGPIAALRNSVAQFIGIDDPKVSTLKQDLVDSLSKKVKQLSGAAVSDKERAFLALSLPRMRDNDEQFLAKLDNAVKNIDLAKEARIEAISKGGRTVEQFREEAPEMVDMVAPDGRSLSVPADQVERMEGLGAKRK